MAFLIKATLDALRSYLAAEGWFGSVTIGEPKAPPSSERMAAALFMANISTIPITLARSMELHGVTLRIYRNTLNDPEEQVETDLADAMSKFMTDIEGDWQLGGAIHHIDTSGAISSGVSGTWGYLDVGGTMFRVIDVSLPLVVDTAVVMAP